MSKKSRPSETFRQATTTLFFMFFHHSTFSMNIKLNERIKGFHGNHTQTQMKVFFCVSWKFHMDQDVNKRSRKKKKAFSSCEAFQ
jgi:dTDP-4-dehydrorhamnose 3,5-epimerase-like enzyme